MIETLIINWNLKSQRMYGVEDIKGAKEYIKQFKETGKVKTAVYWNSKGKKNVIV